MNVDYETVEEIIQELVHLSRGVDRGDPESVLREMYARVPGATEVEVVAALDLMRACIASLGPSE